MAGAIADETIMRLVLQYDQFIKGMQESRAALKQFQDDGKSAGSGMASGLIKQFGQIKQFAGLTGDATGGVAEKMSSVSSKLQEMVKNGQGGSKQAEILSKMFGRLKGEAAGVGSGIGGIVQKLGQAVPGFSQVSNVLTQVSSAFPQLAAAAGPAAVAVLAVAAAYKFIIIPGMEFNAMLEQQSIAFTAMLKSGDKATAMMNDLKKLSLTTPIGLGESSASAKQMLAYGFAQNEIIDNMKLMKTVASAVNVSLSDITYVYGTLRAQGRAYTRDLMQFAMRGIPIYEYLSKTMGITVSEIKKATEEGRIGFTEVEAAMKAMTGEGGKFNGMLEASMKTTQGLKTQIKNTWQMFTGEAAAGTSAVFKGLLSYFLSFVKDMKALGPTFNALFTVISTILVLAATSLTMFGKIFAFIARFVQNVILTIIDIVKWIAQWFDKVTGISKLFKAIGDGAQSFGSWLLDTIPVLNSIRSIAGDIGEAIKKWWDRDTSKGSGRDTIDAEFGKSLERNSKQYMELVSRFGRRSVTELPADQIAAYATQYGYSAETVLKAMANFQKMTQKQYDDLLRNTQTFISVNRNYWEVYRGDMDDLQKDMELNMNILPSKATVQDALGNVEDALRNVSGFTDNLDMAKLLGMDSEETKASVKGAAQSIADTLYTQIEAMRNIVIYKSGEGKTFLDGLIEMWKKYNQMVEKEGKGKKTSTAINDLLSQYIEFRSEWATVEEGFDSQLVKAINDRIGSNADIKKNASMLDRQIAVIEKKYNDMYAELAKDDEYMSMEFFSLAPLIEEMRRMEKEAATLQSKLQTIQDRMDLSTSGKESVSLLKEEYDIQVEINRLKALTGQLTIADQKALMALQEKQVKFMLEGDQKALKQRINQYMTEKGAGGSVTTGTSLDAAKDTDVGKLIAGADPIVMALTALFEMITSIENVAKVLNFFGTVMDGVKSMIEGPLNAALAPLVMFLTKIGEIMGAILVPIFELFGDYLNVFIQPLVFVAELFKRFIVAIKPLIKLILIIQNPFLILGELLKEFMATLSAVISTEEDHQKDLEDLYNKELATLQNLYEVGALSGAEYEARLAELKARYGMNAESNADPALVAFLKDIFDAIDEMGAALNEMFQAFKPVIDFLIAIVKPVMTLMLQLLGGFFKDIAKMVTYLANFVTSLLKGDWGAVWTSFVNILKAVAGFFLNPLIRVLNFLISGINELIYFFFKTRPIGTVPEFAEGTSKVAENMYAMVHKGEGIIPSNFMDAIRSGDLSLSGSGGSSGGNINVYITVDGSVTTERDLCKTIYDGITVMKRKGQL